MDRLACVSFPAFPLQLLLRRQPEWAAHPAAVLAEDKPQGPILWVNERARRAGVLSGLRYAAGLSLAPDLRAGVVPPVEIEREVAALTERLRGFTPAVEPSEDEPGVFWLDASGLDRLYPSLGAWARSIHADLTGAGFHATVVVGFTRFGTCAVAKALEGTVVFNDLAQERAAARGVPLDRLELDPDFRDTLAKLGVKTVGALLSLPAGGLLERFGPEAYRVHRLAAGELWAPLQPLPAEEPIRQTLALDDPEADLARLIFLTKRLLHPLLATLVVRGEALAELALRLALDETGWREEQIRPAAPTLEVVQLLDLVRLRLETVGLSAGVVGIELTARGVPASREQLRFFAEQPRRDLDAANRALARLRAEFGDEAVVRARLTDGHFPEAGFVWEPVVEIALPRPRSVPPRTLVRRILVTPIPLPARPRELRSEGWLVRGREDGLVTRLHGPYVISGGWWQREAHREYYFAETRRGDLLWIYYDRPRRKWFLHGMVE
ncbi:MAG: DNA polymerase Y family protein [Candidatus Rokubacteria bacterium]|nr:DNA polymerase Y family protein [Candidatus Rokubacteria bacterium]